METNKLCRYLAFTFLITYFSWILLAFLTNFKIINSSQGIFALLHMLGGFGPTAGAVMVLPDRSPKNIIKFIFSKRKGTFKYLIIMCGIQAVTVGFSSMKTNPFLPWYTLPFILIYTTFLSGGNEELGWRGIMQPILENRFSFYGATLITGCVWMVWHIPLWFIDGTSQQNINFILFSVYGIILSFCLGTLYNKTNSVFYCSVFHGFSNMILSFFVIKVNCILILGLIAFLIFSIFLYRKTPEKNNLFSK